MLKFFGIGKDKSSQKRASAPEAASSGLASGTTLQHTDVQRERVRVVLKDTLRKHGIPAGWVGCEVTGISHHHMDDELFVHLIVMTWNEALVQFAPALQQQLMQGLDRFEPNVDHSNYVVSWLFSPDCQYPHTEMPPAEFWSLDAEAQHAAMAGTQVKPKFDLADSGIAYVGTVFTPTEPAPLRSST